MELSAIGDEFGVRYHEGHVWKIPRALGWSPQRPVGKARERNEESAAGSARLGRPLPQRRTWIVFIESFRSRNLGAARRDTGVGAETRPVNLPVDYSNREHKSRLVREFPALRGSHRNGYLPPYAPELNPVEWYEEFRDREED